MYKSLRAQTLKYWARPHQRVPTAPIETAAAWRGSHMREHPELWTFQLSAPEVRELHAAQQTAADFVGLLCLQKAKSGGLSRIASSVAVFNELMRVKPQLVPLLFEPLWFDTKGEGGVRAFPIPPCRYYEGELRTFWQSDYYRTVNRFGHVPPMTPELTDLLDTYDGIANSPAFHLDMDLQPGDVQLISNHTILHARTGFEDWPELERRRHLLRLWISIPEPLPLGERLRTWLSLTSVVGTAALEIFRERQRRVPAG